MLGGWLTRLYTQLLRLYPGRFTAEFGGEMAAVFSQALAGLEDSAPPPFTRRLKMTALLLREVWDFPRSYLDARRYQVHMITGKTPAAEASPRQAAGAEAWVRRPAPWTEALLGALPFLLFGLAYLVEGIIELGGHSGPVFTLPGSRPGHPAIALTLPIGVYFVCVLGLVFGVIKGFPRWSYAYLGLSSYFGWYYANGRFYGVVYDLWAWLPLAAALILGLLLARSLRPLTRLLQGIWYDWTRLTFGLYAFFLPMVTTFFFDDDWGVMQLYGLVFNTLVLAAGAVVFLRSRTTWGRMLSLLTAFLIMWLKEFPQVWMAGLILPMVTITLGYLGILLLPVLIGLLRRGVQAWSAR